MATIISALRSLPPLDLLPIHRHLDRRLISNFHCNISSPCSGFSHSRARALKKGNPAGDGSQFMDDEGQVKDMDGYLNYLSLEYESVWDTKPAWCQPWTILLTGALAIACSWFFVHSSILTAVISSLIGAWWFIFLYSYPKAYADMIAERRENVVNGVEDTFGIGKDQ